MKKTLFLLTIGLMALSCNDHDIQPKTNCRLSESTQYGKFSYDAQGRVATMTTEVYFGPNPSSLVSAFTYGIDGKLSQTVYTVDGKPYCEQSYTYTNGRISQVMGCSPNTRSGINQISYDEAGRITRITNELAGVVRAVTTYAYNAVGVLIESTTATGAVQFRTVVRPVGSVKSSEGLLRERGLPYVIPFDQPWATAEGGVGTVAETYQGGPNGQLALVYTEKTTAVKTNASGYLIERSVTDEKGQNPVTLTYTLADCQ